MPLNPKTQWKLGQLEKHLLDFLDRDGGKLVEKTDRMLLDQAGRHLQGLLKTLKQLPERLEKRTCEAVVACFRDLKGPKTAEIVVAVAKDPVSKETGKTRKRTNK